MDLILFVPVRNEKKVSPLRAYEIVNRDNRLDVA